MKLFKKGLRKNAPIPAGTNLDPVITDREPLYDISNYCSFTRRPTGHFFFLYFFSFCN